MNCRVHALSLRLMIGAAAEEEDEVEELGGGGGREDARDAASSRSFLACSK